MKKRNLKVYSMSGYKYEPTPTIILRGKWLESLHFNIGDYISVSCEDGRLVITPDTERAKLEEAKAEYLERETKALRKRFEQEKARLHELFVAEGKAGYGV